jgi:hypothetical protein
MPDEESVPPDLRELQRQPLSLRAVRVDTVYRRLNPFVSLEYDTR